MPVTDGIDSYLICSTPRTGSTLLCGLLESTGVAGRPRSYFRPPDESAYATRWRIPLGPDGSFEYRDYVKAAVATGRSENGVFGARIMWGTMDHMTARLRRAHGDAGASDLELLHRFFGRTRFLSLRRSDTLAQAVSWTRAEQTDRWQDEDTVSASGEPHFDGEAIGRSVTTIEEHESAWRHWFARCDVQPFEVLYEDLIADMAGVVEAVLRFLGLTRPAGQPLAAGHRRQADLINDDWIRRFRALPP